MWLQIQHEEQKIRRLQQQLHDQRQTSVGANPDSMCNLVLHPNRSNP